MGRKCNDVYGEEKVYYYPGAIVRVRRPILTEEERARRMKIIEKAAADLLRSMGASRWQIFRHLEFPAALGYFFSGLRVSVSYAVVGAVISEWLGGFEGLGVYMTRVRKAYAFDKMFAVIIFIVVVSLLLMALVTALRRLTMPWEAYEKIERND